jgi:Tol biopolymer transport system component
MRRRSTWALVVLAACKAQVAGVPGDGTVDDPDGSDGLTDAPPSPPPDGPIKLGKWGPPVKLGVASSAQIEDDVTLSANTLELFFAISGTNGKDLFVTTRPSATGAWTPPDALPFNTAMFSEETPRLSADDKTLYFASNRGGTGALDIYKVTRAAPGMNIWSAPQMIASVSTTPGAEKWFMPCGTDRYIMVRSVGMGDSDLVEGTIGGAAPAPITELNSTGNETGTFVSPDCLSIYFASTRVTPTKLYRSQRAAITMPWDAPTPVNDFPITGGDGNQEDPWMSSDSRTFAFVSDAAAPGNKDVYLSTR